MPETLREGDHAVLVFHGAVFGLHRQQVRKWAVSDPKPYAQYDLSVSVSFIEPRKRTWKRTTMYDSYRWITVETDNGEVLYDSRSDVPCDMTQWSRAYREHGIHSDHGAQIEDCLPDNGNDDLPADPAERGEELARRALAAVRTTQEEDIPS